MTTGFKLGPLGGSLTDLRTAGINVLSADAWDSAAKKRGGPSQIAYQDGAHSNPRKFYSPRELPMEFLIMDTAADGTIFHPAGRPGHLRENMDQLLGLLYARDGFLDLTKTVPGTAAQGGGPTERQAVCEVLDVVPIREEANGLIRSGFVRFLMLEAFWRELPQQSQLESGIVTASHGFNVVVGGNRPIRPSNVPAGFEIEWTANASISNLRFELDSELNFVQYGGTLSTSDVLLIDVGTRTGVLNGTTRVDSGLTFGHGWWLDLDPGATTAVTASVTSASDFDIDVRWYDRWA